MRIIDELSTLTRKLNIILADDDKDDCLLFREALEELHLRTALTVVHDGEQLRQLLKNSSRGAFDVLFLDLNMPRKNGLACLEEIKRDEKHKSLPVIIFSTSYDPKVVDLLYEIGAQYYICKPAEFSELRSTIREALLLVMTKNTVQPPKESFLLRSMKAILV